MTDFLHGVEVIEIQEGVRPIRTVRSAVIGLVGSAPKGPVNTPTLIAGSRITAATTFGAGVGTIPDALEAIFQQTGAVVVVVNTLDPAIHKRAVPAAQYTLTPDQVVLADRYGARLAAEGITPIPGAPYVLDTDYTADLAAGTVTRIATGEIAADATVYVTYTDSGGVEVVAGDVALTGDSRRPWGDGYHQSGRSPCERRARLCGGRRLHLRPRHRGPRARTDRCHHGRRDALGWL